MGAREDDEQAGSGHVGRTGAALGALGAGGVLEEARWAAQKVWPQWRVTGARRRAGGAQSGQWRRARRARAGMRASWV